MLLSTKVNGLFVSLFCPVIRLPLPDAGRFVAGTIHIGSHSFSVILCFSVKLIGYRFLGADVANQLYLYCVKITWKYIYSIENGLICMTLSVSLDLFISIRSLVPRWLNERESNEYNYSKMNYKFLS